MSGLLLNTLKDDLEPHLVQCLENDPQLVQDSQRYLQELLINDDLLSTDVYTTTTGNDGAAHKKTLIEEIAEFDHQYSQINAELASITNNNRDLIIDTSRDLKSVDDYIAAGLSGELEQVVKILATDNQKKGADRFLVSVNDRLNTSVKSNTSVLSNIDSVLDILELPTICKLCILQGNFQESLEISMLAQTLVIRFPKLMIFRIIQSQVDQELQLMVKGLIKLLNTNLKQNNILKIFQILNKPDLIDSNSTATNGLPEQDKEVKSSRKNRFLKMIYLNARFKFITNEIATLKPILSFNKQTYLKRFIEIYREYILSSLSIYNAIFNSTTWLETVNSHAEEDSILINQFIKNLATLLVRDLVLYFPEISNPDNDEIDTRSQKDGIILQILYLCRSLSKYGVDFETILASELCFKRTIILEEDWQRNLSKVKKFRLDN